MTTRIPAAPRINWPIGPATDVNRCARGGQDRSKCRLEQPFHRTLEQRARAYLDANCGHCHNAEGPADTSGLFLTADQKDPMRWGFCKVPVAAGHGAGDLRFDLVHGQPDESILLRRMNSAEPKVMMPEIGRSVVHREGVDLIRQWVAETRGNCGP